MTCTHTPSAPAQNGSSTTRRRSYVPNVDIVEVNGDLEVHVDLPGANPESIAVNFEDGTLTIEAEVVDRQPAETKYFVREYGVGHFHRAFRLADTYDTSRVDATYKNGVLKLSIPKAEQAKPKRIEVRANY